MVVVFGAYFDISWKTFSKVLEYDVVKKGLKRVFMFLAQSKRDTWFLNIYATQPVVVKLVVPGISYRVNGNNYVFFFTHRFGSFSTVRNTEAETFA